jgi:hypothetical protein
LNRRRNERHLPLQLPNIGSWIAPPVRSLTEASAERAHWRQGYAGHRLLMPELADCIERNTAHKQALSTPDAVITWTTSAAQLSESSFSMMPRLIAT